MNTLVPVQSLNHSAILINIDSSLECITVDCNLLLFECNIFHCTIEKQRPYFIEKERFAVFTKIDHGGMINLFASQITREECYGPVILVMMRKILQKDEYMPTNINLLDFKKLADQNFKEYKSPQVMPSSDKRLSILLVVSSVIGSSLCQQLEDERFFEALERLSLGPEGRVETFYIESNAIDVSFTCMRTDECPHEPITFNHTHDSKGELVPDVIPKKITIQNLQDFCDTFVSRQEGISSRAPPDNYERMESYFRSKGQKFGEMERVQVNKYEEQEGILPFEGTEGPVGHRGAIGINRDVKMKDLYQTRDSFYQLTHLMIMIFERYPHLKKCLEVTQRCQKFLLSTMVGSYMSNSAEMQIVCNAVYDFIQEYKQQLSSSHASWLGITTAKFAFGTHILLLSTAFNSCKHAEGIQLYETLLTIIKAVTGISFVAISEKTL